LLGPPEEPGQERLEPEEAAQGVEEVLPEEARPRGLGSRHRLAFARDVEFEIREALADLLRTDLLQVSLAPRQLLGRRGARWKIRGEIGNQRVLARRVRAGPDERVAARIPES